MKIAYVIILSVLACSLLFFILIMKPKEKRVSRIVFECFLWAWLVMIASIACVFAINYNVCYVFHTIYFIFMDCLIFSFMIFCVRYAFPKIPKWIYSFGVLIIVDIIHFAINLYTRHAFSLITVHLYNDVLLKLDQTPYFAPHLALCFVMLAVGFFFLIKQIIKAPGFYKIRYIYILCSFIAGIVANTLYLILPIGLDWSVGVYSVICFFSYYFINHHVPIRLQHVTLNNLAEKMDQGLVFYDIDGSCVYISRYFKEYFDIKDCESEEFNNLITKFNDIDENTPKVFEKISDDKTQYYEVYLFTS